MGNLGQRLLSAAVLVPPLLALVFFAPVPLIGAVVVLAAFLGGLEVAAMAAPNLPRSRFVCALLTALAAAAVAMSSDLPEAPLFALALLGPLTLLLCMFQPAPLEDLVRLAFGSAAAAVWIGALFGILALVSSDVPYGRFWLLLLFAGTFLGDTGAYFVGRAFGRRKLAPRLSPAKTWAGAVGGALATAAVVALAKATVLPELLWIDVALLGLPLALACQCGDLAESFVKRGLGVKDSGQLIPGHGGLLDRCDALLFGAPVVWLFQYLR